MKTLHAASATSRTRSLSGALAILRSEARIDLLITDVGLPGGINGRQIADAGRALRANLKVLFVTGYAESAVLGNEHLDPDMQIMTKPFTIEAIGEKIRQLLDSRDRSGSA